MPQDEYYKTTGSVQAARGMLDQEQDSAQYWEQSDNDRKAREDKKKKYSKQDQAQLNESLRYEEVRQYNKDLAQFKKDEERYNQQLKVYNDEVKKYEAQVKAAKFNDERLDARWFVIPNYTETRYYDAQKGAEKYLQVMLKRADTQEKKQSVFSEYQKRVTAAKQGYNTQFKSQIEHNKKLNEKFGGRPKVGSAKVGILSRTSADILGGKSDVPLKQTSSHIQNQVRNIRLVKRYNSSSMTLREFYNARDGVKQTVSQKAAAEQARRNWSAAISARSNLAKSREAHQFKLKEMNKQNRLSQMAATTALNLHVKSGLESRGVDIAKLKLSQGKPQQPTRVNPGKTTQQQNAEDQKPRSPVSIFDIPQSEFAKIQSKRGLNEKFSVSNFKSTDKGDSINRPRKTLTQGVSKVSPLLIMQQQIQKERNANKPQLIQYQGALRPEPFVGVPSLDTFVADNRKPPTFTGTLFGGSKQIESVYSDFDLFSRQVSKDYSQAKKSGDNLDIITQAGKAVGTSLVGSLLSLPATIQGVYDKQVGRKEQNIKPLSLPTTTSDIYTTRKIEEIKARFADPSKIRLITAEHYTKQHLEKLPLAAQITESVLGAATFIAPIPSSKVSKVTKLTAPSKVTTLSKGKTITKTLDVPVSKEYGLFGKTVVTKTFKDPKSVIVTDVIKKPGVVTKLKEIRKPAELKTKPITEQKVELASSKGDIRFGSTKPEKVASRIDFDSNVDTGYEVFTGSKAQTKLNEGLVRESLLKGKIKEADTKVLDVTKRIVELGKKAPSKVYTGLGERPIGRLTKEMNVGLFDAINVLQSPKNLLRGRRRVGQVGGSISQNPQLKPKYQKSEIHDVDLDVRSEKVAERSAKTVYEKVKPFETPEIKIDLASRPTKVESKIEGVADEFFEALSPKDALKGNKEALSTGLRFGEKYRVDKLSSIFKAPIKDPDTGIKIRDIKDQTLAKASSVASIQSKATTKFRGEPKPEHALEVAKLESKIDSGLLAVAPPPKRMKDVVDLYNIAKSQSEKLRETRSLSKQKAGLELDKEAEKLKGLFPDLDYTANTKGNFVVERTSSYGSLFASKFDGVKPLPLQTQITSKPTEPKKTPAYQSKPSSKFSVSKKPDSPFTVSSSSKPINSPSITISKAASVRSFTSNRSLGSNRPSRSNRSLGSKSPRISITSPKSPIIQSPKSPAFASPKSPAFTSPKSPTSPTIPSGSGSSGTSTVGFMRGLAPMSKHKVKPAVAFGAKINIKSTKDRKPGRKYPTHDFLGNTKTDHIVGLFRRKTVMVGDRKTDLQVKKDKKVNPWKGKGLNFSGKGGFRL